MSRNKSQNIKVNKGRNKYSDRKIGRKVKKEMGKEAQVKEEELHNDPNWYFLDANIANQASSFAFDRYLGVENELTIAMNQGGGTRTVNYQVPAIMAYYMNPSAGNTAEVTTGINMASLKTYTVLSSMNAKTTQYAPQDITTLILALGEVISIFEHIRRCFGIAFTYNQRNRTLPLNILLAMGVDADEFLANIAQYRLTFNSLITAFNKVPFLANIAYLHKCADMYQRVYMDSESPMAQLHVMVPYTTWLFNEAYSDQGTGLETLEMNNFTTPTSMSLWLENLRSMVLALLNSTTLNYIYSDILNYANKTGAQLLFLDYLREDYAVVPEYNKNFLVQVHNMVITGIPKAAPSTAGATKSNDVAPNVNKNQITYKPVFGSPFGSVLFVDLENPEATVVDRIEATRYLATSSPSTSSGEYDGVGLPDHYCVNVRIFKGSEAKQNDAINIFGNQYAVAAATQYSYVSDIVNWINISQFDWHLIILMYVDDGTAEFPEAKAILGDLNYFTTVDAKWLQQVNDLTFQALFALR